MTTPLDPFVDVLFRERGEALHIQPDEPVTLLKNGKPHRVSKKVLTPAHVQALLTGVAPPEAASRIREQAETEFHYASGRGRVRVKVTPGTGQLRAVISPDEESPAPTIQAISSSPAPANGRLSDMLRALVETGSSDLHLRVGEPPIFRTHGEMKRHEAPPLTTDALHALLRDLMPERNRTEWEESGDTDFAHEIDGLARFRVNAARDRHGPVAVIRVIPSTIPTADELDLSRPVQELCSLSKGLVLVTGATGSGKSTTLAAMLDLINRTRTDHVITIEDPIEFVHQSRKCLVTQRQVGVHTRSFRHALRAALREDPDVVLVGELRDLETIAIAIETAETGHLVFGTLHTTTAASTVDRMIDQFPADRQEQIRVMLSESLRGVITQTLCKKVGGGRVAAREILLATPALSNLIREGKTFQIPSVMQTSRKLGMATLNDSLLDLVDDRLVTPQEAYLRAVDKTAIVAALRERGHRIDVAA